MQSSLVLGLLLALGLVPWFLVPLCLGGLRPRRRSVRCVGPRCLGPRGRILRGRILRDWVPNRPWTAGLTVVVLRTTMLRRTPVAGGLFQQQSLVQFCAEADRRGERRS